MTGFHSVRHWLPPATSWFRPQCGSRAGFRVALALLGLLLAGAAQAGIYQLYANTIVNVSRSVPLPLESDYHTLNPNWLNDPRAAQWLQVDDSASLAGGHAEAKVLAHMGLLKAYASASFPFCCDLTGHLLTQGYADAEVSAGFYDTILVEGAGLALGTPVSYTLNVRVEGTLSRPAFEMGGYLGAYGVADIRLSDLSNRTTVSRFWQADRDLPGSFNLVLQTEVGREIGLSAMLSVGASVSSSASTARFASADFYHSAGFSLTPSVSGLNTMGASGHDFAISPVPEPATLLQISIGMLVLLATRRGRMQHGAKS